MTNQGADPDRAAEQLTRMLADLADDPDAPASTVTARSVLEAARAAGQPAIESAAGSVRAGAAPSRQSSGEAGSSPVVDLQQFGAGASAARTKASRRRTALLSLASAAAVAAVAAVVIPMAISGNSGTTSANSAREAPVAAAPSTAAAGSAQQSAAAGSAAAGAADANAAPELATGTEADRPTGASAPAAVVPTGSGGPAGPLSAAGDSCWPPLPDAAAVALTAVLPAGSFSPPTPLTADCGTNPVAGATLVGTAPGTALEVRVSEAAAGRCAVGGGGDAVSCVPSGGGVYLGDSPAGSPTVYVYGNGIEVVVGPPTDGLDPTGSGLTGGQTAAAAQAVLTALS
ncbi:MAG: hypothetical protein ABWZ98_10175 [Nakamurella sp.]